MADHPRSEFEEQQLALGGYDTGSGSIHQQSRINREQAKHDQEKQKRERNALLLAQQFSQDLQRVGDKIHDAQAEIYEAIMQTQDQIRQAEQNASHTEDGRAVFFDENGTAFAADGKPLTQEELENITQKPDAISWEEYCKMRDREYRLMQIDNRLMDMANQIEDLENEGYSEENQAILDDMEEELHKINASIYSTLNSYDKSIDASTQLAVTQDIEIPDIPFKGFQP